VNRVRALALLLLKLLIAVMMVLSKNGKYRCMWVYVDSDNRIEGVRDCAPRIHSKRFAHVLLVGFFFSSLSLSFPFLSPATTISFVASFGVWFERAHKPLDQVLILLGEGLWRCQWWWRRRRLR
jgi:hypothetical protein